MVACARGEEATPHEAKADEQKTLESAAAVRE